MSETKPRYLYHFTRVETAAKILSKMQLRLNDFGSVNDPTENLNHIFNKSFNPSEYGIARRMRELKMLCFSFETDNNECVNLQPMWYHYGDRWKGICLKIDYDKFVEENQSIIKKYGIQEGKVTYDRYCRSPIPEVLIGTAPGGPVSSSESTFKDWITYESNWRERFFCKDHSWRYESEYRFLAMKDYTDDIFLSISKSLKKVILGLDFDLDANSDFVNSYRELISQSEVYSDEIR